MLRETFEIVAEPAGLEALPLRLRQHAPAQANGLGLLAMTTLAAVVVLPQIALAGYALVTPDIRQALLDQPVAAAQLGIALTFWIVLFGWPLSRLVSRINRRRDVEIADNCVVVRDQHAFGVKSWTAPLHSYSGVAHQIRSSLAGTRHELVLVHREPAKSVVLRHAPLITDVETRRMSALLGLPEIAAAELYRTHSGKDSRREALSFAPVPA